MRNPLIRRIPREFRHDIGKYLAIFAFMVLFISMVSGFIVTDISFLHLYEKGFSENRIEDGHFSFRREAPDEVLAELAEKGNVKIYPYFYFEEQIKDTEKNIRVYSTERELNYLNIHEGELPSSDDGIALDRMFADNNDISVGDRIILKDRELTVTGKIASPDYSSLFENPSDMVFDSINFSVAVMSAEGFEKFGSEHITYNYAWLYPEVIEHTDKVAAKKRTDSFIGVFEEVVTEYDEQIIDKAVDCGKLVKLSEAFKKMDADLEKQGGDISVYDNEKGYDELLGIVNEWLEADGIDSGWESAVINKEITITADDIKTALRAEESDIDSANEYITDASDELIELNDFLPRYLNQAINFVGEDMSDGKLFIIIFDYILTIVLAFVFAITVSNTIAMEANVIGTLRASGYTKGELLSHYIILPVLVTFSAAVAGNILGYTLLSDLFTEIYYDSYSLPKYEALWSAEAFIYTTVIPVIIMLVINIFVVSNRLKLSPIKLIRRDLSRKKRGKALRLNEKIPFFSRFRLRIIMQNIPAYITMFFGIFIGGVLVVFGTMFQPLLADYKSSIVNDRICDYQYILGEQCDTADERAEKYALTSLKTTKKGFVEDEISVFGIEKDSRYVSADISDGKIAVSDTIAEKFSLGVGDTLTLKDPYNEKKLHNFTIGSVYGYNSGLAVFMTRSDYCEYFNESGEYFTGYFSNNELDDIEDRNIVNVIRVADLTKISDQITVSMGNVMGIFKWLGVIVFCLLMFIMSKQIIEKNANSISMTKILGFGSGEIGRLYIIATSVVVVASLLLSIPLINAMIKFIFENLLYIRMKGYIPFMISAGSFVRMVILGLCSYIFIAVIHMIKINRIPKSDALKNTE